MIANTLESDFVTGNFIHRIGRNFDALRADHSWTAVALVEEAAVLTKRTKLCTVSRSLFELKEWGGTTHYCTLWSLVGYEMHSLAHLTIVCLWEQQLDSLGRSAIGFPCRLFCTWHGEDV
jgi:hypothetical protein